MKFQRTSNQQLVFDSIDKNETFMVCFIVILTHFGRTHYNYNYIKINFEKKSFLHFVDNDHQHQL